MVRRLRPNLVEECECGRIPTGSGTGRLGRRYWRLDTSYPPHSSSLSPFLLTFWQVLPSDVGAVLVLGGGPPRHVPRASCPGRSRRDGAWVSTVRRVTSAGGTARVWTARSGRSRLVFRPSSSRGRSPGRGGGDMSSQWHPTVLLWLGPLPEDGVDGPLDPTLRTSDVGDRTATSLERSPRETP